jgi:hypothetical protein
MGLQQKMKEKLDQAQDKASAAIDKASDEMKHKPDDQDQMAGNQSGQQPQDKSQG